MKKLKNKARQIKKSKEVKHTPKKTPSPPKEGISWEDVSQVIPFPPKIKHWDKQEE